MASTTQTVTLDVNAGTPEAEITFGDAVLGVYECKVLDPTTNQALVVFSGDNEDDIPDKFSLGQSAATIKSRNLKLTWTLALQLATTKICHVKIVIRQDNATAQNGEINFPVPIDDTDPTIAMVFVRFA
jgi:hypothetical protein